VQAKFAAPQQIRSAFLKSTAMQAFHSARFVLPLPAGHRFPMSKYSLLCEAVQATMPAIRLREAHPASADELALVHERVWVEAVANGTTTALQQREIGFPWSQRMADRALVSVGATIQAARAALAGEGVAANMAGGTHHARADRGAGFCVFNDVAVAARLMQAEHRQRGLLAEGTCERLPIVVIDLDVHQGDGTAALFAGDASVFTLSLHGERNYPVRKELSDLDVPLPDGCTDDEYLAGLDQALETAWQRTAHAPPQLAFYLAGADPHEGDRLGRLKVSDKGMAERDRRVFAALRQRRIPVAVSMAGGYGHDMNTTVGVHRRTLAEALVSWQAWQDSGR
jgi:acetoin utilization deacetylase AcuC-like enzyme